MGDGTPKSGDEALVGRLEMRWQRARDAWHALAEAQRDRAEKMKEHRRQISAVASALELLLRNDKPDDEARQFRECVKLRTKQDKLEKLADQAKRFLDGIVAQREETLRCAFEDEQLPLFLADMSTSSSLTLEGARLAAGDLVHDTTQKGARAKDVCRVIGFRMVDGKEHVLVKVDTGPAAGMEMSMPPESLSRAEMKEAEEAHLVDELVAYGGLKVGDEVRDLSLPRRGKVVRLLAGVGKVAVLFDGTEEPIDMAPANLARETAPKTAKAKSKKTAEAKPPKGAWKIGDRCIAKYELADGAGAKSTTIAAGAKGMVCHVSADGLDVKVHFEGATRQVTTLAGAILRPSQKGLVKGAKKPAAKRPGLDPAKTRKAYDGKKGAKKKGKKAGKKARSTT
jgi:hypothetical protein